MTPSDPIDAVSIDAVLPPEARATILTLAGALMLFEFVAAWLQRRDSFAIGETAATFFIAIGGGAAKILLAGLVAAPYYIAYQSRLFDIPIDSFAAGVVLFLAVEFCYYWMHRAAHRVRWMWATHRVHHSATKFNLTAALRLGWTGPISGNPLFFAPLVLLGFPPLAVIIALGANLAYQFLLHTEREIHLGPLEWVLNTPAHHRLHHASNDSCLDTNFGGVLIIFDRLFGTLATAPKDEALRFGLKGVARTDNPIAILFSEWWSMLRDAGKARSLRDVARALFRPPS